jgi:MFS family permease
MDKKKNARQNTHKNTPKNLALQLVLLMGLVSALGDITYETGRGTSGPYLAFLGASGLVIGITSGLGEFLGYALRLVSGYLADRTRSYWIATFIGYGLILSIPLLAFTDRWEWAVVLFLLERIGKAIRSPARDTILSHATHQMGRGWGFAIHEAMDQVGAVVGPLIFTAVFMQRNSYRDGFNILWIPAILTVVVLIVARLRVPAPEKLEDTPRLDSLAEEKRKSSLPRIFWVYGLFTFLAVAGFANFQIISYHLVKKAVVPAVQIPVLYAVAMGVDALAALVVGKAYDKIGLKSLIIIPFITLPLPFLAFSQQYGFAVVSAVLWGGGDGCA